MTIILRRLPFSDRPSTVTLRNLQIQVKRDQIIVWVGATSLEQVEPGPGCPFFPAILDTANNFTFSIREVSLRQWAGLDPRSLDPLDSVRRLVQAVPTHAARLWLCRNVPGKRDASPGQPPLRLDLQPGIAVYPNTMLHAPRLPLLGLRALAENRLHLCVDGERRRVSLRTPDCVTWFTKWLD